MKLIKNKEEIDKMISAGYRLSLVFESIQFSEFVGKTKKELDLYIAYLLEKQKMKSCCLGYRKFPGYSCISLNDELVHGVPDNTVIRETDFLKVDICASYDGFCADAARIFFAKNVNSLFEEMYRCAHIALAAGIAAAIPGNTVGCIGNEIEETIKQYRFAVVEDFAGHGIGRAMHESPEVLNYGKKKTGQRLYSGMALAIEPMFCQFSSGLQIDERDNWTARTADRGYAAHIEDTVIITDKGPFITTRIENKII